MTMTTTTMVKSTFDSKWPDEYERTNGQVCTKAQVVATATTQENLWVLCVMKTIMEGLFYVFGGGKHSDSERERLCPKTSHCVLMSPFSIKLSVFGDWCSVAGWVVF